MGLESLNIGGQNKSILSIIEDIFKKENIELKSDVNDQEIAIILEILWHNEIKKEENQEKMGLEIFLEKVVPKFLELKVSKDRKSREEVTKILSSVLPSLIQQETNLKEEIIK